MSVCMFVDFLPSSIPIHPKSSVFCFSLSFTEDFSQRFDRDVMVWSLYPREHAPFKLSFLTQPIFPLQYLKKTVSGEGVATYFHLISNQQRFHSWNLLPGCLRRRVSTHRRRPAPSQHRVCTRADRWLSTHSVKVPTQALNGHDLFLQKPKSTWSCCIDAMNLRGHSH